MANTILKFRIAFYSLIKFFVILFAKTSEPTLPKTTGSNNITGTSTYNGVICVMICGIYHEYSGLCGDIVGKYNINDNDKNKYQTQVPYNIIICNNKVVLYILGNKRSRF